MVRRLLAAFAEATRETLGDHAVEGRTHEERLDVHLGQAGHGAGRVVGVQGREHEVTGEGGFDGDLRGLVVADLTQQHHIRVASQDRAERAREGQARPSD